MRIVHLALGGCLRAPPVFYGITADTGGHIAYVLAASYAQTSFASSAEVTIVTRLFEDAALGGAHARRQEMVDSNVRIVRVPTRRPQYLEKEALAAELPSFTAHLLDWLSRERHLPDVIHAHFADAAAIAAVCRETFGIPFVYTPHALGLDKVSRCGGTPGAREVAEAAAIRMADAIVVSSRDEVDRQIAAYGVDGFRARTHVVPPGVPQWRVTDRTLGDLDAYFAEPRRPLLLAVARPTVKKNLVGVAEAFVASRLRDTCNLMILAGQQGAAAQGAEERTVLARLRAVLKVPIAERRAALPARHESADVRALYGAAAASGGVFASPALHEPFGLTLLEAAAAGLPVVATMHGGAGEIVRTIGHGLLVDPRDRDAIAAACLRVVDDPALRRSLVAACAGHGEAFCWTRFARRSLEIYAGAIDAAPRRRDAVAA